MRHRNRTGDDNRHMLTKSRPCHAEGRHGDGGLEHSPDTHRGSTNGEWADARGERCGGSSDEFPRNSVR